MVRPGRLVLVVGPSGAGKDTIIAGAKAACAGKPSIVFPRRIVTRATSAAEDHDTLNEAAFEQAVIDGGFAFWWQAHGLKYGIPRGIDDDIRAGRTVICNVSRSVVTDVRARYENVDVVLVTAPTEVLAARLAGRARDSDGPADLRIKRNDIYSNFRPDHTIDNSGALEEAIRLFLEVVTD
ncbi:MAG: phosphonate metabolism protein/1,5-bisphosphokinase (PRPP-forming) PhnN [Pseudolabrys sp.]|nr:phosphonate metabolism protein/1,5-bisphosphokinase (PRPP-forming) PhnN [Pseudolabrys sp.]MDP2297216.1 phosphonate metabolism protein/1,5-bisphosphokinase (PRPP-forming) PhnN [Pseudolabrys sp.]